MIKILLLTQWFEPEPTFKGLAFAQELKSQGFDVEVVTGFPNYPGGKIYPEYKIKWFQKEIMEGIVINRVPLYPSHDRSSLRRFINYVSFAVSALIYILFFVRKFDVIYAYHPPLTVGIVAALVKKIRKIKMVLDVQDLWPDTLRATGMISNQYVLKTIERIAFWQYESTDQVVVLSEGFQNRLQLRGVSIKKIKVIKNWADVEKIKDENSVVKFGINDDYYFNILFAGNMGSAQALNTIIETALILNGQGSRIRFILLGSGLEYKTLKNKVEQLRLNNVIILQAVEMKSVGGYLRAADALLVHLKNDELFEITIPSKIQAYMSVGKPILLAVKGDAARLIIDAGCGVLAEPENSASIALAAVRLESLKLHELHELGQKGKDFYNKNLALRVGVTKFANIFREICNA
jgi:colanic acid biosynthesis glycosyl transferase WcaI